MNNTALDHPERSRFSGVGKDLAFKVMIPVHARSLRLLVKARAFGMTFTKCFF
jgi:hypothetical protein